MHDAHITEMTLEQALDLSKQQMQIGNFRAAELALTDILKSAPDNFNSLHLLGLAQYYLNHVPLSIETLNKAYDNIDATPEYFCNFGSILAQDSQYSCAINAFDRAIANDPDYAEAYWNKANVLCLNHQYAEAEVTGRIAIEKKPDSPEAWLNLGMALIKLSKTDQAIEAWETALKHRPDFSMAFSNLGNVFRENGQISKAENMCNSALKHDPQNTQAMNNLGNALLDQGHIEKAENWYKKAISIDPQYAEAHNNLSICFSQQGRVDDAVTEARYATLFDTNYAEAYMNLSKALRTTGQFEEAERAIQKATELNPSSAEIKMDLADMLLMQDRYSDAELILKNITDTEPDNTRVHLKLSAVLERANRIDDALTAIDHAVNLNPEMPESYIRKGQIYHLVGQIDKAEESYQKALSLNSRSALLHVSLSDLYQSKGDLKASAKHIKQAQDIAPETAGIYTTLCRLKKFTADDPDFKMMLELVDNIASQGLEASSALHFALFSAYHDIGDTGLAFEHLEKANQDKRKLIPHFQDRQAKMFDAIKKAHDADTIKALHGKGCSSEIPVFVLGMPRSGTTLTEQVIASHPDAYGAGELHDFVQAEQQYGGTMTPDNCHDIGKLYVDKLISKDPSGQAKRITDKMPGNFLHIGKILSALPNAKIIHCKRDPIDTCFSCYKQNFSRGQYWSYDLKELGAQYNLYDDLMAYWQVLYPDRFLEVHYEDTVSDLETQARKIIHHIGLNWHDACLAPHKHKRAVLTASKTQVIKPVYQSSVKAWEKYKSQLVPLIQQIEE